MAAESETGEVCALMSLLVRAMVSKPDAVRVSSKLSPSGSTIIQIKVAQGQDLGKLIGIQERTARSLRIIFQAIAKEQGKNYQLDIDGATIDPTSRSRMDER
jgi:predicted RNA-binding protein YlqC (UPF0109 family)